MKLFWWTKGDLISMIPAYLYSVDTDTGVYPQQSYDAFTDVKRMLAEGYQEITADTARTLGYPLV